MLYSNSDTIFKETELLIFNLEVVMPALQKHRDSQQLGTGICETKNTKLSIEKENHSLPH